MFVKNYRIFNKKHQDAIILTTGESKTSYQAKDQSSSQKSTTLLEPSHQESLKEEQNFKKN
jgi:hypothetical protein